MTTPKTSSTSPTSLTTPRAALVLILGIIASGLVGMRLAISELPESEMGYAVGATALVTFTLTALALIRRSWARLPLLVTGFYAGGLILSGFFPAEYDPSVPPASLGYLVCNLILVFFAVLALVVSICGRTATPKPELHEHD